MKMHLGANLSTFKTAVLGKIGRSKKCSMRKLTPGNTEFDDIRRNYSPSLQRFRQCVDDVVKEEELSLFNTFGVNGNVLLYKDLFPFAQNGNAKEVARIVQTDPSRLHVKNNQGQNALHLASLKGHQQVVEVLIEFHPDLDVVDNHGNTALHLAVSSKKPEIIDLLLKSGANPTIKNHLHMMPIHVAAELNNIDVVNVLLDNGVDANWTGESGMTALHYAAAKDNGEVMKVMMQRGGKPCKKCDYGYYPIHIAAKCAAASAMEAIIDKALQAGYTREQILSFKDRENNLPLHAAVNGGNIKAVKVCLIAGASVKAQQDDGSTPLHFACAQGNFEMIKLMKEIQQENFLAAIFILDVMKMSPLHRAAFFNHTTIMEFLLEHGADKDCRDINDRTPLLLAASKGCWAAVQLLVSKEADVHVKDKRNRNFLHLAVKYGGKLEQFGGTLIKDIQDLQNDKDDFGCTPLHYASKEGHLRALDDLIKMGAVLNMKNNDKQSPFHFAARYGRYNTCRRLLDSHHGPNIINETDGTGLTALHIAAQNGHTKVVQLLLQRGAVVNKDNDDNTALHHAAANGWTHTMKVLISVHSNLIDVVNTDGDTPLHVAAKNGQTSATVLLLSMGAKMLYNNYDDGFFDYIIQNKFSEVAVAVINHDRWEEVLQVCSKTYGCYVLGLIEHLPAVCMNVLDRCQIPSNDDPKSANYHITYNFKYLDTPSKCLEMARNSPQNNEIYPLMSLYAMVRNNRVDCLSHPVCVTFLKVKWKHYGIWVYSAYLIVYILFLASLTSFVVNHNSLMHFERASLENSTASYLYGNKEDGYSFEPMYIICLWFMLFYSFLNIIKEVGQIITMKLRYFADIGNGLEWALYITCSVFVLPFLLNMSFHWQWEAGAFAVFLAWFNCLVFLQRFDFFGIYVVMFLEILRTLVQVLCVFSILIIAFGLSFYMLLFKEDSKAFSTPALSLLKTFMMMLELDYMASFNEQYTDDREDTLHFGTLTLTLLTIFVLLMPILLMNLLIGLAVGDIESVQKDARLKRLAMQVELHINIERKMPLFLHEKVTVTEYKQYPNRCQKKMENFFSMISFTKDASDGRVLESRMHNSYLYEELYKQKVRLRDMSTVLDKNNQLLRKIMQKMEIHTEDDAWDEGAGQNSDDSCDEMHARPNEVNRTKTAKEKLYIKSAVISLWKK
ncbi:transient receptor potential cation channel subfamily A member 1-like isoform X2 [Biomphalaria glabrata]|uniref:Transient receptor potential cation channel subfamily A member 1-like isoform X2 n=1 Tax=Biomphalaria glabrata TaxID=6526 RepID=A0A9W3AHF1_BIOGL|nr:transient receptor potential cation channel subfamily A member 1-like isoform X2 [Biomphalaria glabrata]